MSHLKPSTSWASYRFVWTFDPQAVTSLVRSLFSFMAQPTLNTLYWTEDRPDSFCLKMATAAGAREGDLIAFGHTHKPWYRVVEGIHFLNTGSVGKPKDGDWRAGYVLVDASEEIESVEFMRVAYDLERSVDGILTSTLPDEFADQLRSGGSPKPVEVP